MICSEHHDFVMKCGQSWAYTSLSSDSSHVVRQNYVQPRSVLTNLKYLKAFLWNDLGLFTGQQALKFIKHSWKR